MEKSWHEWVIAVGVTLLSLFAVWTVFGDDVLQLLQTNGAAASKAEAPARSGAASTSTTN